MGAPVLHDSFEIGPIRELGLYSLDVSSSALKIDTLGKQVEPEIMITGDTAAQIHHHFYSLKTVAERNAFIDGVRFANRVYDGGVLGKYPILRSGEQTGAPLELVVTAGDRVLVRPLTYNGCANWLTMLAGVLADRIRAVGGAR